MSEIYILSSYERKKVIGKWLSFMYVFYSCKTRSLLVIIKSTRPVQTCTKPVFKIYVRG